MTTVTPAPAWGVYGHDWAVEHLRQGIAHGRVRHAYLLIGAESIGKERLARAFASALLCTDPDPARRPCGECSACRRVVSGNHADVLRAREDDDGAARIDTLRTLMSQLALKPYEGRYRFGVIPRFDQIRGAAQDALLKTLEEPGPHALLILLARSIEPILPTILSRAQVLQLRPASVASVLAALDDAIAADPAAPVVSAETRTLLATLSGGRVGWALAAWRDPDLLVQRTAGLDLLLSVIGQSRAGRFALAGDLAKDKDKEPLAKLLALWQSFWRDALLVSYGVETAIANRDRLEALEQIGGAMPPEMLLEAMRATNRLIARLNSNVNLRLALEVMLLDYPGL
ncbi:MAG: DNA polymerase III subunit delta' C-terminal domain-containing protein [Chloroflexota bacterium]|nr:DNA polymerase III subunit delta' C-terminal domain-containing protein [Chloroflexota bacterium]